MRLAIDYESLRFMLDIPEGVKIVGCEDADNGLLIRVEDDDKVLGAPEDGDYRVVYALDDELGIVVLDSLISLS